MSNVEGGVKTESKMLAAIVHDLRHTLFRIGLSTELMREVEDDDERTRGIDTITEAIGSLTRLVQDLDEYNQRRQDQLSVFTEHVDPFRIIDATRRAFEPIARARSITLSIAADDGVQVAADSQRLVQTLSNVVHNALVHTPPGGVVVIAARAEREWVRFSVSDTGPGIAPSDLPHIFDCHWRSPRASYAGRGLGLTIARALVEQHGGAMWAENGPSGGALFAFTIPRA